jgi:CBS domain-containing protein
MRQPRACSSIRFGALPVVEGERLAGIISTSDVLRAFLEAN